LVARYGGDEFVMLGGSVQDAIKVAERVREKVEFECLPQEEEASLGSSLTVSVGVATLGEDTATLQRLIRAADEELYRAKAAGKNRVAAVERR
jgi:diguanylate cyclase (GGDEF)-like protein